MSEGLFKGGNRKGAKVTPTIVLNIRRDYSQGYTQGELCRMYGLGIAQIGRIVRREAWTDVVESAPSAADLSESAARLLAVQRETDTASATERMVRQVHEEKAKGVLGDKLLDELKGVDDGGRSGE